MEEWGQELSKIIFNWKGRPATEGHMGRQHQPRKPNAFLVRGEMKERERTKPNK